MFQHKGSIQETGKSVCVSMYVCVSGTAHGAAVVRNWQEAKAEALRLYEKKQEEAVSSRTTQVGL